MASPTSAPLFQQPVSMRCVLFETLVGIWLEASDDGDLAGKSVAPPSDELDDPPCLQGLICLIEDCFRDGQFDGCPHCSALCIAAICNLNCRVLPFLKLARLLAVIASLDSLSCHYITCIYWSVSVAAITYVACSVGLLLLCCYFCNRGASWSMFWCHCCHHCRVLKAVVLLLKLHGFQPAEYAVLLEAGWNYGLLELEFLLWLVTYGLYARPCLGLPLSIGALLCCLVGALFAWVRSDSTGLLRELLWSPTVWVRLSPHRLGLLVLCRNSAIKGAGLIRLASLADLLLRMAGLLMRFVFTSAILLLMESMLLSATLEGDPSL
ncbi:hypothetical protein POTOM_054892 [Populus tomentosa]|uniref:Uncharacterized protein n=1 Tax=Populus tomentosa TaxID=118781 RepID=A0A8X7Y456_POPTO|nr:hypothetical protein POTOM_054892 [Populus tomentosa]